MNRQRPEPPHQRRPRDQRAPESPTRRVTPPQESPYQPPLAWSAEPDPRYRPTQSPPPAPNPRPTQSPRPSQQPRAAGTRPPAPGYAPRQDPQPIPARQQSATPGNRPPPGNRTPSGDRTRSRDRTSPGGPPRKPAVASPTRHRKQRKRRKFRVGRILLVLLLLIVVIPVGLLFFYDGKLHRVDALSSYAGRIGDTPGSNWLIVGTDSRAGLSTQQKENLATGDADGARTDTIMMAHLPLSGKPMLISIPRDLYVPIPGMGSHKINAAFNNGGPQLLVRTVEEFTGVHIDHYVEIGFGGFDQLVDSVGGVEMCLDQPLRDPKAGLRLPAGCQTLNGQQALGLVRTRAFPNADLERVVNQRKFLAALMAKATSPSVLLNPFKLIPFVNAGADAVTVDNGDHLWDLAWLAFKISGNTVTTTAPSGGDQYTDDGDSLIPDDKTSAFFGAIARGQTVPDDLLSTGTGAVS